MRLTRSSLLAAALLLASSGTALATWSVVITNRATGEIGIAQATCIVGPDLQAELAVVRVRDGAGIVQAWWDSNGTYRRILWDELRNGTDPVVILDILKQNGGDALHQFGIVDLQGRVAAYTAASAGGWAGHLTGVSGDWAYAVQGNVLAGENVILQAEQAILNTPGDMADKLLAAMLAAAQFGGDGRCSCSNSDPDSCGSPPPGFDLDQDKSAHTAFMLVSRQGDETGNCNRTIGCANGSYYMSFQVVPGQNAPPDPIKEMEAEFVLWRTSLVGRPDHLLTQRSFTRPSLPGNGNSTTELQIRLADYLGDSIPHGGHAVTVEHASNSAGLSTIGTVVDHGDGSYSAPITAGTGQGLDVFRVVIDDGIRAVLLYPFPQLELRPTLSVTPPTLSASAGGTAQFALEGPEEGPPPRTYLLLGSISGTAPGIPIGSIVLPLNFDWFLWTSFRWRNGAYFADTEGVLNPDGSGAARFLVNPGDLSPLVGIDMAFAYFTPDRSDFASNPVLVTIVP